MPTRGQENLQNLRMKGRVSKDRVLIYDLGGAGAVFLSICSSRRKQKSKIQTMFIECACKPATFVYHYLWFHTAPSLEKSLPKGRTASTAIHLPATLWAAAGSWCTQPHCTADFVLKKKKRLLGPSFWLQAFRWRWGHNSTSCPCPSNGTWTTPQPWCARVLRHGCFTALC